MTISAGLASREFNNILPVWVNNYAGDTLWALMVFLLFGFLFSNFSSLKIAVIALIFSYAIEISQLYHAPWIDAIRSNRIGGLVLGFGFLWSDLVCYSVGILVGFFFEKLFSKKVIQD